MSDCCECRRKSRSEEDKKLLINRLSRISGQISGIKKMVENDIYCVDILTQTAAARSALDAFSRELMASHVKSCVVDDIKNGSGEAVDELLGMLQKFMK